MGRPLFLGITFIVLMSTTLLPLPAASRLSAHSHMQAARAFGTEWHPLGPAGGVVYGVTISPHTPQLMLARSLAGTSRSTDGGATWTLTHDGFELPGSEIMADPHIPNHFVRHGTVSGEWAIFHTYDGGLTWVPVPVSIGNIEALRYDPFVPNRIYAVANHALFRSLDQGETWTLLSRPPDSGAMASILLHPTLSNQFYITTDQGWVLFSDDGGDTIVQRGTTASGYLLDGIEPVSGTIYAHQLYNGVDIPDGIVKSTDNGASWQTINSGLPEDPLFVRDVKVDAQQPTYLYATLSDDGVYRSTNGGESWEAINSGLPDGASMYSLTSDRTDAPTTWYVSGTDAVYWSRNRGETWEPRREGLNVRGIIDMESHPSDGNRLYAMSEYRFHYSADGGTTWESTFPIPDNARLRSLAVQPTTPATLFLAIEDAGVHKSTDDGVTWIPANLGLPVDVDIHHLVIAGATGAIGLAFTAEGEIYRSTNSGDTWEWVYDTFPFGAVAVSPSDPMIVWAGTSSKMLYSTDAGLTWQEAAGDGLPGNYRAQAIAIHPTTPATVYIGLENGSRAGYRTFDGGETWQEVNNGVTGVVGTWGILIEPGDPDTILYASHRINAAGHTITTPFGVRISTDGGTTWNAYNAGLTYRGVTGLYRNNGGIYVLTLNAGIYNMSYPLPPPPTPTPTRTATLIPTPSVTASATSPAPTSTPIPPPFTPTASPTLAAPPITPSATTTPLSPPATLTATATPVSEGASLYLPFIKSP